ncbi:MAG: hypothetical protein SOR91_02865 [Hornefia butyriciproducens]|nr:hypothetical protein [Hornefia butyriciproducens]MDY2990408.1 hypothetical protein [Hornefia butyriciproducens]
MMKTVQAGAELDRMQKENENVTETGISKSTRRFVRMKLRRCFCWRSF